MTSNHVDEDDTKGPNIGLERRIRNKLAVFIETF